MEPSVGPWNAPRWQSRHTSALHTAHGQPASKWPWWLPSITELLSFMNILIIWLNTVTHYGSFSSISQSDMLRGASHFVFFIHFITMQSAVVHVNVIWLVHSWCGFYEFYVLHYCMFCVYQGSLFGSVYTSLGSCVLSTLLLVSGFCVHYCGFLASV